MGEVSTRILKNTGFLYLKMGITVFISLWTTRIILEGLGHSDFGIYNIVGGALSFLGFINASMAGATQRFMSFEEGSGNLQSLKKIFNISVVLHFVISILSATLMLVVGFFLFKDFLQIPDGRIHASIIVYLSLIVSMVFTVMNVPYDAALNAHENMRFFAIIGIMESFLKLVVAYMCLYSAGDRLVLYGILMSFIPIIIFLIMLLYCHHQYVECEISIIKYFDWDKMKEMTSFAGWSFLTSSSSMMTMQGVSLVLNYFFGVLANAAQGVGNQISGQVMALSNSMLKALNPVIVKSEGAQQRERMKMFVCSGSKLSFMIYSVLAIPFIVECDYLFEIWLKTPPIYSVAITKLILIRIIISRISAPLSTAISATGQIKYYSAISSLLWISIIPTSVILYLIDFPLTTIYYVLIVDTVLFLLVYMYFAKKLIGLEYFYFTKEVLLPCTMVVTITFLSDYLIYFLLPKGLLRFLLVSIISSIVFIITSFVLCLNKAEKLIVKNLLYSINVRHFLNK